MWCLTLSYISIYCKYWALYFALLSSKLNFLPKLELCLLPGVPKCNDCGANELCASNGKCVCKAGFSGANCTIGESNIPFKDQRTLYIFRLGVKQDLQDYFWRYAQLNWKQIYAEAYADIVNRLINGELR